jgi:glycosyltransferase involved in cell wall biosynthesis
MGAYGRSHGIPKPYDNGMKLRILHVIDSMDPASGGAPAAIRQLVPHMQAMDAEGEVVCFDRATEASSPSDPFPIHRLGKGMGPWRYQPSFRRWLRRELSRFDACIVHGMWLYNGYACTKEVLSLRGRGASIRPRVYIMPHGMLDPWFQQASHRRWKALRNRFWWWLIEGRTVRDADGLIFTMAEERRLASLSFQDYRPARTCVVGLGTDGPPPGSTPKREDFENECPGIGDRPYMLYMGRIDVKKGLDMLLEVWGELLRTPLRSEAMPLLVIAGPGWETPFGRTLRAKLQSDARLTDHVLTCGMLHGDAKWGALKGCEAFILPSRQENFGVAVAEALSCGRPVLLTEAVNTHLTVTNTRSGLSCRPDRVEIRRMLEDWMALDAEGRARMSSAATEAWRDHFTLAEAARRLLEAVGHQEQ